MVTGKFPFKYAHPEDQKYKFLHSKNYVSFWKLFENDCYISEECKDLIQNMLEYDPDKRIPLLEILDHPWLNPDNIEISTTKEITQAI